MPGRPRAKAKRPEGRRSEPQASGGSSRASGALSGPELLWSSARSEPKASEVSSGWERIYAVVRRIPPGRVATYGDVAVLAGMPRHARQVGWALHALDAESDVPWQRVINARGAVSVRGEPAAALVQRALLESEGVVFGREGRVDLATHRWRPRRRAAGTVRSRRRPATGRRS